ncbi:MAG: hypothetical protein Q8941_15650 [Bacteroidota bacterium]|nr:hypothetical protein [Bacteroidota bacterium]
MKKKLLVVLAMAAGVFMFQLFNSCRHEIPYDYCQTNPIHVTATSTNAVLNQSNGTITATATGGSGFKYSLNGGPYQDTGYFSGLQPFQGYNIVARNSWGCTDTAIVTINSFNPCTGVTIVVNITKTDAAQNQSNGTITAAATGGTGFTYSLNGGAYQSSGTFSGLAAGNYTVTAKNANGCTGTGQTTIGVTNPCAGITVAVSTTQVNPTIGQSNGSITAIATGGSGFTYSLNGGAYQSSGTFTGLAEGIYSISAKNSNGCTGIKQVTLTAIDPCAGVTVTVTTTQVNPATGQSNGSITATATGGTGFTYSLNGGAYQSSGTFAGLPAGNYIVTAKNSNGCLGSAQVALGSTNPCTGVTITVTTTQVNPATGQSNGSITASATGGSGFTYSLNGGAYQASGTFSGLAAGSYTVSAKNSNGCLGSTQVTLTATNPCTGITVTVTTTQVNPSTGQSNGSITASATGGSGFTYSLNGGAYQASGTFSGLAAGTYTVSAKNSNGCLGSTQVTLTATNPCTNTNITLTSVVVNYTACVTPATGKITITAAGSTGFTYNLNNGAYQSSNVFSGLTAASYTIGAKDLNGCTKTATVTVGTVASGPLFAGMRTLITTRCSGSGCHMNGGSAAGYNFDSDCSILSYWNQINGACILGTLVQMPKSPQPPLTAAEKAVITNWINAGHLYSN